MTKNLKMAVVTLLSQFFKIKKKLMRVHNKENNEAEKAIYIFAECKTKL